MKSRITYTLRSTGLSPKTIFLSEERAYETAQRHCETTGNNVAVVMHSGDNSRLVRKFSKVGKF